MRMKERAAKLANSTGGGDDISTNTIRSLFGAGRNDIINAAGGYTNTFWHEKQLWFNDLSENFVMFTLN